MMQNFKITEAPDYIYNDQFLTVSYSFSEYKPGGHEMNTSKLWLDVLFVHPQKEEAVTICVAKSTRLLCQPKEMIEAVVHREIRNFVQPAQVKKYKTAMRTVELVPAF